MILAAVVSTVNTIVENIEYRTISIDNRLEQIINNFQIMRKNNLVD
jgi:hypothetical protein